MSDLAKDTRLESHKGLIHKLCKRAFGRSAALGLSLDYEDLFQEGCIAWMAAEKKFNPQAGFYFSTYLGTAVTNRLNRVIEAHIKTEVKCGGYSLDEPIGEDGGKLEEVVADEREDLLGSVIAWDTRRKMLDGLSPLARWVVLTLENPSREVLAEWKAYQVLQAKRQEMGETPHPAHELNLAWLGRHFLLPTKLVSVRQWDQIRKELRELGQ